MSIWRCLTRGGVHLLLAIGLAVGGAASEPAGAQAGAAVYLPSIQREPDRLSGDLRSLRTLAGSPDWLLVELNAVDDVEADGIYSVWFSRDGGGHWQRPATQPWVVTGRDFVTAARATLVASPAGPLLVVGQTFRVGEGHLQAVLYTSVDDGTSWVSHPLPESQDCPDPRLVELETTPAQPERLYLVLGCNGVLGGSSGQEWVATRDGGATWEVVLTPDEVGIQQWLSPARAGRLFVMDREWRVHRTDDDGASWTVVGVAPNGLFTLTRPDADRLLAETQYGPLVSTDSGATWRAFRHLPCVLGEDRVFATIPGSSPADLLRCADGRLIATPDAGATWLSLPGEPWPSTRYLQPMPDQAVEGRIWVATHDGAGNGLWRLDLGPGATWTPVLILTRPWYL